MIVGFYGALGTESLVLAIYAGLVGIVIGSFVMAATDRGGLPKGRSHCDGCKKTLDKTALIPILGWLIRRGRCKQCGARVSARYPIGEIVFGLISMITFIKLQSIDDISATQLIILSIVWLAMISVAWAMATIDWRSMILPDKLNAVMLGLGLIRLAVASWAGEAEILNGLLGASILFAVFYLTFQVSRGKWIGGGDVKLAPSMGLLAGPVGGLVAVALASYVALGYVMVKYLASGRKLNMRGMRLSFGPFLLAGAWLSYLAWPLISKLV